MAVPRKLAVFGVLCLLCFALFTLPARIPLQLIANDQLRFSGVSGTVWRARVNTITAGNFQLRNTGWEIVPLKLLGGQVGGAVSSRWNGGFLSANVGVSFLGNLSISDAEINTTAAWLARSTRLLPLSEGIDGQIRIDVDSAKVVDNWPTSLVGRIALDALASSIIGVGSQGYIGNVVVDVENPAVDETGKLEGLISDAGGPLRIVGTVVLTPPGNYDVNVRVTPGPQASDALRRSLDFSATPDSSGSYPFGLSGSL